MYDCTNSFSFLMYNNLFKLANITKIMEPKTWLPLTWAPLELWFYREEIKLTNLYLFFLSFRHTILMAKTWWNTSDPKHLAERPKQVRISPNIIENIFGLLFNFILTHDFVLVNCVSWPIPKRFKLSKFSKSNKKLHMKYYNEVCFW